MKSFVNIYFFRSKEMFEVYKNVYRLRQQLLALKEGFEIKKSTSMDMHCEGSSTEHSDFPPPEEDKSAHLQQQGSGIGKQMINQAKVAT